MGLERRRRSNLFSVRMARSMRRSRRVGRSWARTSSLMLELRSLKEMCHERWLIPATSGRKGMKLNGIIHDRASALMEGGQDVRHLFSAGRTVKHPNHLLLEVVKAGDELDPSLPSGSSPLAGTSSQERDDVSDPSSLSSVGHWLEREDKFTLGEKLPTLCGLTGIERRVVDSGLWGFQPLGSRRTHLKLVNLRRQIRELGGQRIYRAPNSG